MRCAFAVALAAACFLTVRAQAQGTGRPASSALDGAPASFDADPRFRLAEGTMTPLIPPRPSSSVSRGVATRPRGGVTQTAAVEGEDGGNGVPPDPTRQAFQGPDTFRTPHPTPVERPPSPGGGYAPQLSPEQFLPRLPPAAPSPPMPPLAPLVNTRFSDTWLPAAGDELGMNDFDVRGTLAMGHTGVFVTPGYGMHFLNGPTRTDLPGTLYDAYVDVRWKKQLDATWGFELAFTPSFFSDLDNTSADAYRNITTAIGFYAVNPQVQLMAGVMYLDRFDINWFPLFGLIYAPGDSDWRHEFVFPRPKFARRVLRGDDRDAWVYVSGEFGGGAWAVERECGCDDMIAYRDWRAMLGYETKVKDFSALSWFAEGGMVFNRELEYRSGRGDYDPDACGMVRLGVSY